MPKSSRKTQPPKKLRSETPPPTELEDAIAPELAQSEASVGTPTSSTYVVSEADTASGTSSAGEDNFILPLPVVPAPTGKASKVPPPARSPDPAPRLIDTANLLLAHSPGSETISFDAARGRAAHLRRRLDELHQETVQGLRPGTSRSTSPPRPGARQALTLTASHWNAPSCRPGTSLSSALNADQLAQIRQLLLEDRNSRGASATAQPEAEPLPKELFSLPLLPCLLYTSPSPRD